jgi:CubicO group peptidase (beta-lactamase class C family)
LPGSIISATTAFVTRQCVVPKDLDSVVQRGVEDADHDGVEAVWSRTQGLYRSGVHPGIQVCIRHRGNVVLDRAIGHARGNRVGRRLDHAEAVTLSTDTPINLFSAGKSVTAMAMHKLEEQGVLCLDDTVVTHLPEFARHGKESITLRQLMTHRAGIPRMPPAALDLDLLADLDRVIEHLCELRPSALVAGPPAYHAVTGGLILEAIVRRTAGRSLRDVLAEEIKSPLGLQWLDFGVASHDVDRVAWNVKTGLPVLPPISMLVERVLGLGWDEVIDLSNDPRFLSGVIPSANVITTARDIATFYQCLLDGGHGPRGPVFDEDTVERATRADRPALELDRMLGVPLAYSTGFMLGTSTFSLWGWNQPRAFGHLGLSNSFTWADPERELVVAILTTGKPLVGPHLPSLVLLIAEIQRAFPTAS